MTRWRYAERAALLLRRTEARRVPNTAARQRGIATIERALTQRARWRSWQVTGTFAALAASAAAAMVWLWLGGTSARSELPAEPPVAVTVLASPLGAGATLLDAAGPSAVDSGRALEAGARIVTAPEGAAELRLSTGTRLELGGASALALERRDGWQRFSLSRGKLEASVAKLAPRERFVVGTPDAEVEVRGTEFRLRVLDTPAACGQGTRTRLEVREGVVEVRRGSDVDRVGAGEHWPRDCASQEEAAHPVVETPPRAAPSNAASARSEPSPRNQPAPRSAGPASHSPRQVHSTLPEQNALFAEAVRAKQRGDGEAALALYAELLREFPDSPLAENALVQRMRLLGERDRGLAQAEAERYLQRYPRGFAEREARELAEPH